MVYLPHWPIPATFGKREINYETVFERMATVLEKLGNPQKNLKNIIHIAGTNGKGSAASLIAKIYEIAGYKTHLYTSPHLHDCNERIVLNGRKICDGFLFENMEEVRIAAGETPLTFMEAFTIGTFLAFAKTDHDVAVIECGMGGRIDATNIIEQKLATLLMPISFDHSEYLGNSIERIALEKALIIRPRTPLIVAAQAEAAKNIIKILAADQKIPAYFYDEDFEILRDFESGKFDLKFGEIILENLPKPNLLGDHQYINFSAAISATLAVKNTLNIATKNIEKALENLHWPSRIERVNNSLNGIFKNTQSEIFIDGAHNEAGALALSRWIYEGNFDKNFVICGFSKNKCKKEFLEKFRNIAEIIAVKVDGEPYPENCDEIVKIGKKAGIEIFAGENLANALLYAAQKAGNEKCRIVICGSLHLARDLKKISKNGGFLAPSQI